MAFKECGQDGVDIRLVKAYDSAKTICTKTFTTNIKVTALAATVLAADVFGNALFRDISCHKTGMYPAPPVSYVYPFLPRNIQDKGTCLQMALLRQGPPYTVYTVSM